jgi:hypothetical protein
MKPINSLYGENAETLLERVIHLFITWFKGLKDSDVQDNYKWCERLVTRVTATHKLNSLHGTEQLKSFCTRALWYEFNCCIHFIPRERTPGTHCTGGWVVPRAGLDTEVRWRILLPLPAIEPRSPGRPVRSQTLYWLSYPSSRTVLRSHKVTKSLWLIFIITHPCSLISWSV